MGAEAAGESGGGTAELRAFRRRLYGCIRKRADALFELADAMLTAESSGVPSAVHLSLAPVHRRSWGSLYAALNKGRINDQSLRDLLAQHLLDCDGSVVDGPKGDPAVYAVDVSAWPRCDAEASPERGYYYHPSRHSAGQPIVAGWAYQLVARLGFEQDSWVTPVDAQRITPQQDANEIAAKQVRDFVRRPSNGAAPVFVFDAGYDPVRLQRNLEGCHAQILVRLHSGRAFYSDAPTPERRPVGRPCVHGKKFDLKDP